MKYDPVHGSVGSSMSEDILPSGADASPSVSSQSVQGQDSIENGKNEIKEHLEKTADQFEDPPKLDHSSNVGFASNEDSKPQLILSATEPKDTDLNVKESSQDSACIVNSSNINSDQNMCPESLELSQNATAFHTKTTPFGGHPLPEKNTNGNHLPSKTEEDSLPDNGQSHNIDLPSSTSNNTDSPTKLPFGSSTGSLQSSKGVKHLKKKDGEPFWRKDIQYDFLEHLFADDKKVFTNYFSWCEVPNAVNSPKLTFAELYLRTMAESLKSSKVLRERLIKDPEMGINVSKVCFLVNAGRINTTVNFLPDMRSAFRTFHLLPSLQSDHDGPRKPLQDTPRLKSILKAVCDGQEHLQILLDVLRSPTPNKPNTNIIKLVFLMSSFFQKIPFHYEEPSGEMKAIEENSKLPGSPTGPYNRFMEFFLNDDMCPKNRAQRLLWLFYTYLETSFTPEELENNPFNPKVIPPVQYLTEEQIKECDVDLPEEIEYALKMFKTRMAYLEEEIVTTNYKRVAKSGKANLKRQLSEGSNAKSGSEAADDDLADETTFNEDAEGLDDTTEIPEDSGRPNCVQRLIPDRSKRKKPTPSVGSLIESSKKSVVLEGKWRDPQFPILGLENMIAKLSDCDRPSFAQDLVHGSALPLSKAKFIALKTQLPVAQLSGLLPGFETKREKFLTDIYRLFHYKKDTNAGLLGLEWEDIRSDVKNGVETYLYQQLGKELLTRLQNDIVEEDKSYGTEVEQVKKDVFPSSSDVSIGGFGSIDLSSMEKLGDGFLPNHDYNRLNERTAHDYVILGILSDIFKKNVQLKTVGSEVCSFDLENETLLFA